MTTMMTTKRAGAAIKAIELAGERLATATALVQELEDQRGLVKAAAIRRIMQTENEETKKPHSATSAEKIVESDGEYLGLRKAQSAAEVERQRAEAQYAVAKLAARLAIEVYAVTAPYRVTDVESAQQELAGVAS